MPVKLAVDTGEEILDPSPEQIDEALRALVERRDGFAILSQSDDVFIQAAYLAEPRGDGGGFMVEYQEGSLDRHFQCDNLSVPTAEVLRAFVSYLEGRQDYKQRLAWVPLKVAQRRGWMTVLLLLGIAGLVLLVAFAGRALGLSYPARIALTIGIPFGAWGVAHILARKR